MKLTVMAARKEEQMLDPCFSILSDLVLRFSLQYISSCHFLSPSLTMDATVIISDFALGRCGTGMNKKLVVTLHSIFFLTTPGRTGRIFRIFRTGDLRNFWAPVRKNPPATWMDTRRRLVSFHRSLCQTNFKIS